MGVVERYQFPYFLRIIIRISPQVIGDCPEDLSRLLGYATKHHYYEYRVEAKRTLDDINFDIFWCATVGLFYSRLARHETDLITPSKRAGRRSRG